MHTHSVIEAIEYLYSHGNRAILCEGRYCWYAPMHHGGRQLGLALSTTVRDHWSAISELLLSERCNNCGAFLEPYEQQGEPICFSCFTENVLERPQLIRDFVLTAIPTGR